MIKIMKVGYIAAILISAGIFNSCTDKIMPQNNTLAQPAPVSRHLFSNSTYGTYLAGRVAHIRQDFDTAADYYIKSIQLGADTPDIVSRTYLLLTSEGRISEAAEYARQALHKGDKSNFIHFILMAENLHKGNFEAALKNVDNINDKVYKTTVSPFFKSWIYAGLGHKEKALEALNTFKKDDSLNSIFYMHVGMINDYFDDRQAAQTAFDTVINDENIELSYRSLQIIGNFYIRSGQQNKAAEIIKNYYEKNRKAKMLYELYKDILNSDPASVKKLIANAQQGEAEAIFNIGTIFRAYQLDVSQIYTALALYLNPNHEVAQISVADILESNRRLPEAINHYEKVGKNSPVYFMAQLKIANIYMQDNQNQKSLQKLQSLLKEYPNDYQVMFNLGEVSRMMGKPAQAIKYYNKTLEFIPETEHNDWTVYYALGMAYERNNEWHKAEEALKKALKSSNRNPFVLNYLGYNWLKYNVNSNEALYMIFEAHRQNPEDGHIIDSVGWALYRMGKYAEAVTVLERAAEHLPANAIVCDHLGDAYWQIGRKTEARFQWQHALSLKEDAHELNKEAINRKISNGLSTPATINFNEALLVERLKSLNINP